MKKINRALWAKKKNDEYEFKWLPLKYHLYETGKIAGLLWEHWLSQGQRKLISTSFETEEKAKSFVVFVAMLHDIGKATPVFQIQKGYNTSIDLDNLLIENLENEGFNNISNLNLSSAKESSHDLAGQYILEDFGFSQDIASIIGAHHGKPVNNNIQIKKQKAYPMNYYQSEDSKSEIYLKWKDEHRKIIDWALRQSDFSITTPFPSIFKHIQLLISGIVIMSDWIASNEKYFPLISLEKYEIKNEELRIMKAWTLWKKTNLCEFDVFNNPRDLFKNRFNFYPNELQEKCIDAIYKSSEPGLFIIEAPMGIGKTEAAFFSSEQLAKKLGRAGIFFGLPSQATSDGIFPRALSWLENIADSEGENYSLRLRHSKAELNEDFMLIPRVTNIYDGEGSVITNDWFAGRKTSALDDFVVGTVDNFLLLALKQRHLALRHLGFSKKVVIIDEVHAYDTYMNQYLLRAINWMGAYSVPVIILSATLPFDRRLAIIKAYLSGKGLKNKKIKSKTESLDKHSYPIITYTDNHNIKQVKDFNNIEKKQIKVIRKNEDEIFDLIFFFMESSGIIGIVLNTVKRAQEFAMKLTKIFGDEYVCLLHSNFISQDRIKKEKALINSVGKNARRPNKKIIIGTQVIEQSLDIDFDVLITDLAPIDLFIQRTGRLHRHKIKRPKIHKQALVYIMGTNEKMEFEKGSERVYGGYLLARTQYFLPDIINIPDDISGLVANVYEDNSNIKVDNEDKYTRFKEEYYQNLINKENKAKTFIVDKVFVNKNIYTEDTLVGFLNNESLNKSEETAYAQVRDIDPSIEVIALEKKTEGYGIFGDEKDISNDIDDREVIRQIMMQTLKLPRILSSFNFDKTISFLESYNLENLYNWQSKLSLKGSLGVVFDENSEFIINDFKLRYDSKYGLMYERIK